MRKMTFLACAAMLTSAFVLGSCNKNDQNEPKSQMPEVKTQFSIALPNQLSGNGANRMPSATVQRDGITDFQGMKDIILVPFATQGEINVASDQRLGDNITASNSSTTPVPMAIGKTELGANSKAKVFNDVSIPLSTASFLFYAKSALANESALEKIDAGSLTAHNLDNSHQPSDFSFTLDQIKADGLFTAGSHGQNLLDYLTSIAQVSDGDPTDPKPWYQHTANASLAAMFTTFSSMHGLSSFEVARVLTDLNKSLKPLAEKSNKLAQNIRAAIAAGSTYVDIDANDVVTMKSPYDNFPGEYYLPDGSVEIKWNTDKFEEGDYNNMASPDNYVYPAQLWYYVNSQIKTSNTSKQTMYDNTNDWTTILGAHTDAISVNSLTRAVAIVNPIQYAVARFDVEVRVTKYAGGKLEDNSDLAEGVRKDVAVNANGFPVTGVLIGGQKEVKADFSTNASATTAYTIFDQKMTDSDMAAKMSDYTFSSINHTLVLETAKTADVLVAVEMVNNTGVDFYGVGNQLIPDGGKFYVVAKLSADEATETDKHVFMQDFITNAKLSLPNLRKAYNTIPDLRTPQLELGFSVDLSWQSGHTYNVDFTL